MNIFETLANNKESNSYAPLTTKNNPSKFDLENENQENDKNIFENLADKKTENNFSFLETLKDIGQQIVSKGTSGLAGAYGDISGALGLGTKETLPGQEKRNIRSFNDPTTGLELDDELIPNYTNLPTSSDIKQLIESQTGIGEGKTPSGRIAGRGAEMVGSALATPGGGIKALASTGLAGLAGQGIREAEGGEGLASTTEILGSIVPSAISGKLSPSKSQKSVVDAGRRIGLTERQITPLIQSEGKISSVGKIAHKGERNKSLFNSIKDTLGNSYDNVKQSLSNLGNVNQANSQLLQTKFTNIRNDLAKTVKASPDKKEAIKFIDKSIDKISKTGTTPEELINFWQDINKSVKWNSLQGGKKSLSRLKEPISEVLNNVAPQAAKDFEMTNQLYSKYAQVSKKLKPDIIDSFANKAEMLAIAPSGLALVYGNTAPLIGLASEVAIRRLATEMLTNPYFQNIGNKLAVNFNAGSVNAVKQTLLEAQKYMSKKYPQEDWGFLISSDEPPKTK